MNNFVIPDLSRKQTATVIAVALGLWLIPYRGFLFGTLALSFDAISYYAHTCFLIDNFRHGIFPLWDSSWDYGMPNAFFLRRINPFNPFLSIIAFLRIVGIPYLLAYMVYLISYCFLGMIGFYRCGRLFFNKRLPALIGFLLILFSPLGNRIFDSYFLLVFTPMVWFFYFLLTFAAKPRPRAFLGMTLSVILLLNTYIPFYFILIFFFFILAAALVHPAQIRVFIIQSMAFARKNPGLVFFCLFAIGLAATPGISFMNMAKAQEIVMPGRHGLSAESNPLTVDPRWVHNWGILEESLYASFYPNFEQMDFAFFHIPVFCYILFFLGILTSVNRKNLFLFVWLIAICIMAFPQAFPLYAFLYQHIFLFKFFKNLHFFLWLAFIPIGCLLLADQWQQLITFNFKNHWQKNFLFIFLGLVHGGLILAFYLWGHRNFSTYLVLVLSFIFFLLCWQKNLKLSPKLFLPFIVLIIAAQPLETFFWLAHNAPHRHGVLERLYFTRTLSPSLPAPKLSALNPSLFKKDPPDPLYVSTHLFNKMYESLSDPLVANYASCYVWVYDRTLAIPDDANALILVARNFADRKNIAYVSTADPLQEGQSSAQIPESPVCIEQNSDFFTLQKGDTNTLRMKTRFSEKKFIVLTGIFNPNWQAWINGKKANLLRAQFAFRGIWVNPGEQNIVLRFGQDQEYLINFLLLGISYGLFLALLWPKDLRRKK